ncbi:MAG: hypothetical protein HRT64_14055, partial [Erythrobacter sp.]|nr:hypothetical protein [Erythrobacter sp.]
MATLLLTAVGTAIGGPIGGAIGAFVGQQADRALFGSGSREGPRLKELSVTTSSYGQPIGRHFGRVRVAGSVIWATDLVESSTTQGGKGRPKTTTYSYSASFAVALSSTPIERLGRIWADGGLLRGAAGDLKTAGNLRIYLGNGDAPVDPLIAADKGDEAPAFRDCAYVVFEDLELADFGNRIPALTFEVFTPQDSSVSLKSLVPHVRGNLANEALANIRGFSDEGGSLASTLSVIDRVFPLNCVTTPGGLRLSVPSDAEEPITTLSKQIKGDADSDGHRRHRTREDTGGSDPMALRYYDEERDYQPGVQRAIGRRPNGREFVVDLPATLTADGAKALANANAIRSRSGFERMTWRVSEINPAVVPGAIVRVPEAAGIWRVKGWEWFDRGIELELQRFGSGAASQTGADAGIPVPPSDLELGSTLLDAFELPAENGSSPSTASLFAAASSASPAWNGAELYVEQSETLVPIGSTGSARSI